MIVRFAPRGTTIIEIDEDQKAGVDPNGVLTLDQRVDPHVFIGIARIDVTEAPR